MDSDKLKFFSLSWIYLYTLAGMVMAIYAYLIVNKLQTTKNKTGLIVFLILSLLFGTANIILSTKYRKYRLFAIFLGFIVIPIEYKWYMSVK